jgi:membrane fusion protein (multidrug efflux system)
MNVLESKNPQMSNLSGHAMPVEGQAAPTGTPEVRLATTAVQPAQPAAPAAPADGSPRVTEPQAPAPAAPAHGKRRWLLCVGSVVGLVLAGYLLIPLIDTALNTESTDDAYVNGHVTFVAPRVPGEVIHVLVDDNMRVKKGDVLVQLDKEPYQVQVSLKRAAVRLAQANVVAAEAKARSLEATANSQRWKIQTASQLVKNQIALLNARVATLRTREANADKARADYARGTELMKTPGAMSKEDFDHRRQQLRAAEATVDEAREEVSQVRASLGLPVQAEKGKEFTDVPPDLDQTFSEVRSAFSELVQTMTQLGVPIAPAQATPSKAIAKFRELDEHGDLDRILLDLIPKVPAVLQAKADLERARHDLEQAELNVRYCDVVSQIDGVVTSRNVNLGNNIQAGQSLMAVRSLTEIWIDANFKETQLADLRIGQRAKVEVDMYGGRREFEGRIAGFTMGTGQTLALLPPQNATGNFVKIVQRLPVRIELTDYEPSKFPLFVGLSVTPYVYYKEPPAGPHAGEVLQPLAELPTRATNTQP